MPNTTERPAKLAVLTSGGDAAGMNPAVRAAVRTGLSLGIDVFWSTKDCGDSSRAVTDPAGDVGDVGGICTAAGPCSAPLAARQFRTRDGRRQAARNLVEHGIDTLVIIGGDGSLTGADIFRTEWSELLDELVERGELERALADAHPA